MTGRVLFVTKETECLIEFVTDSHKIQIVVVNLVAMPPRGIKQKKKDAKKKKVNFAENAPKKNYGTKVLVCTGCKIVNTG